MARCQPMRPWLQASLAHCRHGQRLSGGSQLRLRGALLQQVLQRCIPVPWPVTGISLHGVAAALEARLREWRVLEDTSPRVVLGCRPPVRVVAEIVLDVRPLVLLGLRSVMGAVIGGIGSAPSEWLVAGIARDRAAPAILRVAVFARHGS